MRRIELIKKKWEDENMVNRGLIKNGKKTMKRKERTKLIKNESIKKRGKKVMIMFTMERKKEKGCKGK